MVRQSRLLALGGFLVGVITGGFVFVPSMGVGRSAQSSKHSQAEHLQTTNGGANKQESNAVVSFMAAIGVLAALAAVWTPIVANAQKMPYTNTLEEQKAWGKKASKMYNKNEGRLWGPEPNQKYVVPTTEGQPGQRNIPPAVDIREYYPKPGQVYTGAKGDALRNMMRGNDCGESGCQWSQKNVPYAPRG